jgi:LPXTG-site transpeptidase (sortase) family protein
VRNHFSKIFIFLGLIFLAVTGYLIWERTNPNRLSFDITETSYPESFKEGMVPELIKIEDLNINLPIYPAKITNGRWEASKKGVSYLTSSPIPGEIGNSVLYGHNWPNLLGRLVNAKAGSMIEIRYTDGTIKNFIINSVSQVRPNQSSVLDPTQDRRITLYTCTGIFDSKRFVVIATLQ